MQAIEQSLQQAAGNCGYMRTPQATQVYTCEPYQRHKSLSDTSRSDIQETHTAKCEPCQRLKSLIANLRATQIPTASMTSDKMSLTPSGR